jgi:CDP-diacylglycerol--glycerol-3-phosphate 3-phosphatidyltransferase
VLTASRGLAGPLVVWLILWANQPFAAFWVFILAALTDLIDGWLARRWNADPEIGALIDPLADKLLVSCAWISLLWVGWAPWWLAFPSLLRDAIVAAVWAYYRRRGVRWGASAMGQLMVSYEGTCIGILLFHGPWLGVHWPSVGVGVGFFGLSLSVLSGIAYLIQGPPPPIDPPPFAPPANDSDDSPVSRGMVRR